MADKRFNNNINEKNRQQYLQMSRRIDWRFLLPDPNLYSIGFYGFYDAALITALESSSQSFSIIHDLQQKDDLRTEQQVFDLVVLRSLEWKDVEKVKTLIKKDGLLYWEIDRRKWFSLAAHDNQGSQQDKFSVFAGWQNRLCLYNTKKHIAILKRLGFTKIDIYWHRPDFERCLEIIPLNNNLALKYVFSRYPNSLFGKIKLAAGIGIRKMGLLAHIIPCLSIVAQKSSKLVSNE